LEEAKKSSKRTRKKIREKYATILEEEFRQTREHKE